VAKAAAKSSSKPEFSLSVSRALRILSGFTDECPERSLSEISTSLALSKASVSRFLQALEMHGYVDRDPQTRMYRPGPEPARVGNLYHSVGRLKQVALPVLQLMVQRFGFTSYLSALRDEHMVILAAVEATGPIRYSIPVGTKLPVHNTATGQTALAQLDRNEVDALIKRTGLPAATPNTITSRAALLRRISEVRANGYSINWEERTVGVASVAAAANNRDGAPLCVLSLGLATSQIKRERMDELGLEIKAAASLLADKLAEKGINNVE
jgi:DNA-binding IclR family transcriptional regulator